MSPVASIAASGLRAADVALQVTARNVAVAAVPGSPRQQALLSAQAGGGVAAEVRTQPQPGASLESDAVDLLRAKHAFVANLQMFKAADRMMGSLLDIRA